ncbi:MAG: glucose-6-phosphate isomerase [Spirochaetes bacterium]|nr:glucose-6-phosphate isomerase [Spirochaetota bacterium]
MFKLNFNFHKKFLNNESLTNSLEKAKESLAKLLEKNGPGNDFLGWLDYDRYIDQFQIEDIKITAEKLIKISDYIIVSGIGGSYLGAKAVIEMLNGNGKIIFTGFDLSPYDLERTLNKLDNKDISLIVISKSGTTTETSISFRIIKDIIIKKYGESSIKDRIVCITDKNKGALVKFVDKYGCKKYIIPDDIGGRFSVFTPVGLLPIACAGHDIEIIRKTLKNVIPSLKKIDKENPSILYATYRNFQYKYNNKKVEYLIAYDDCFRYFIEWWKQLFGESEGKDGVGIMPSSAIFTTDLHSIGQYLQQGERLLQETIIKVSNYQKDFLIPYDKDDFDNFNTISNKSLSWIQNIAFYSTTIAHYDGNVPITIIEIDKISLELITELMIFFMFSCGISGYMLNINPFDQPGVEDYKRNMKALMGNKDLINLKEMLENTINEFF